jgi:hypothetical protein
VPETGHQADVFDGREVAGNCDSTLSYFKRQALIARQLDEKPTCPEKRSGPFMRHGHGTPLSVARRQVAPMLSHSLRTKRNSGRLAPDRLHTPPVRPFLMLFLQRKLMRKKAPPAQAYAQISRKLMLRAPAEKPAAARHHAQDYALQDTFDSGHLG